MYPVRRGGGSILLIVVIAVSTVVAALTLQEVGFDDTPYLPDQQWRVHDSQRPRPPVIQPPTPSTQEEPGRPPSDAVMLFDGSDLSRWYTRDEEGDRRPARWEVRDGYMQVVDGAGTIYSEEEFGDAQIHIEWSAPPDPQDESQGRGNSGVIIMGFYEIQVLDSYDNVTYADGQAGAMYGQFPPMVNASRPPGEWQVYDIVFEAPHFQGERLVKPAYVTVFHNGVLLHHRKPFIGRMTYRQVATYAPHPPKGPLTLQDHSDPVRYRNIWVRPLDEFGLGERP